MAPRPEHVEEALRRLEAELNSPAFQDAMREVDAMLDAKYDPQPATPTEADVKYVRDREDDGYLYNVYLNGTFLGSVRNQRAEGYGDIYSPWRAVLSLHLRQRDGRAIGCSMETRRKGAQWFVDEYVAKQEREGQA